MVRFCSASDLTVSDTPRFSSAPVSFFAVAVFGSLLSAAAKPVHQSLQFGGVLLFVKLESYPILVISQDVRSCLPVQCRESACVSEGRL